MVKEQVKKILNWKNPGPDRVLGYWLKKWLRELRAEKGNTKQLYQHNK